MMRRMLPSLRPAAVRKKMLVLLEAAFLQQKVKHPLQRYVTSISRGLRSVRNFISVAADG